MKKIWIFLLIISLLSNIYWGWYFYPHYVPHNVTIPNSDEVTNFCKDNGYRNGYLDGDCGENKVKCYMIIGDLTKTNCLEWDLS